MGAAKVVKYSFASRGHEISAAAFLTQGAIPVTIELEVFLLSKLSPNSPEISTASQHTDADNHNLPSNGNGTPSNGPTPNGKMPRRVVTATAPAPEGKVAPKQVAPTFDNNAKPPKKRGRVWKALGAFLLVAGVSGALFANFTKQGRQMKKEITETIVPGATAFYAAKQNPDYIFTNAGSDHVNILLIGRDVNYKPVFDKEGRNIAHTIDQDSAARSDSMIIVTLDRNGKVIRMLSLPRDARVHLPPNKENVDIAKLNAAHAYGGPQLLMQTLHDEFGLTIQHYAVIKFDGFKKVIDEVGGVYVDVIGALKRDGSRGRLVYNDNWGNLHIDLQPGKQWLNGQQAHDYVRFRMDLEGDPGRIRRQQSLMRALARRLRDIPPWKLPAVVKEIREQFETDMDDTQLMSAGFFAQGLGEQAKVQPVTMYGIYYKRGSVTLNKPRNEMLLQTIFGPTFNPERFLVDSPSTRRWEFGPEDNADKSNPDTRALLIQAGLIKPGPGDRVAAVGGDPSGPSSEPSAIDSGSLNYEEPDANRDHGRTGTHSPLFSGSDSRLSGTQGRRDAPLIGSEATPNRAAQPRRRIRRSENTGNSGSSETTQAPTNYAAPDGSFGESRTPPRESPLPRAENGDTSRQELNVESPIPRPE